MDILLPHFLYSGLHETAELVRCQIFAHRTGKACNIEQNWPYSSLQQNYMVRMIQNTYKFYVQCEWKIFKSCWKKIFFEKFSKSQGTLSRGGGSEKFLSPDSEKFSKFFIFRVSGSGWVKKIFSMVKLKKFWKIF